MKKGLSSSPAPGELTTWPEEESVLIIRWATQASVCLCMWTLIKLLPFNHYSSDICLQAVFRSHICDLSESCEVLCGHMEEERNGCQASRGWADAEQQTGTRAITITITLSTKSSLIWQHWFPSVRIHTQ